MNIRFLIKKFLKIITIKKNKDLETGIYHGCDKIFKDNITDGIIYGEYGCGASTLYVSKKSNVNIISVDSSEDWINRIKEELKERETKIDLKFIDVGITKEWGRPNDYSKKENFIKYINYLWERDLKPNIVLIDGRFRVACFLYSLLNAKPFTKIIFDDYNRGIYHIVEDYLKPVKIENHQALFIVPETLNKQIIEREFKNFIYVFD